ETRLGFVLLADGSLDPIATGYSPEQCMSKLLEAAGLVRPIGACPVGPILGVDLGSKTLFVHWSSDGILVDESNAPPLKKDAGAAAQRLAQARAAAKAAAPKPKAPPAASASASVTP